MEASNEGALVPVVDARELRGRQIASTAQIKRAGRRWAVPSQTRASERYLVDLESEACSCPDWEERRAACKHVHAVYYWIAWGHDLGEDGTVTETVTIRRKTYAQPCWRTYNASQVHEREYVERLLAALCAGLVQPPYTPEAKQAIRGGTSVVVHHRNASVAVQGGGMRNERIVVATWGTAAFIDNYAADLPMTHDTDVLTREQANELVRLGAEDERDEDAMAE